MTKTHLQAAIDSLAKALKEIEENTQVIPQETAMMILRLQETIKVVKYQMIVKTVQSGYSQKWVASFYRLSEARVSQIMTDHKNNIDSKRNVP